MAKYLIHTSGQTQQADTVQASTGVADADKLPSLDANGRLDATMMPVGIAPDTASINATENLSAGDLVNIYDNGGAVGARKADASSVGKEANGFVLDAVTSGANAQVYFEGPVTGLTGLTAGSIYYLSDATAGAITATAVTAAGSISQRVGRAVSTTSINFEPQDTVLLS